MVKMGFEPSQFGSKRCVLNYALIPQNLNALRASLVAHWLRIHLPMQGTRVRALVQEDPTCLGATKPVQHNY